MNKLIKYLAAIAALHVLARLSAGRAFRPIEGRLFLWACRASARPYGPPCAQPTRPDIVVE